MESERETLLVIEANRGIGSSLGEFWAYRELLVFLAWRDILVRYKQAVLGVLWSVLRPLLTILVFSFVFGRLARLPDHGVPYPILVFTAMLPWQLFAGILGESGNSLLSNANLVSKVYFPRLLVPVSTAAASLLDFFISLCLLLVLMTFSGCLPDGRVVGLVPFLGLALLLSLGCGFWFSALNVKYRDFRYIIPFIIQVGLYITPVGFASSLVPDRYRVLFSLNPLVGIVDGFRWSLLAGRHTLYVPAMVVSLVVSVVVFATGVWFFRKTERSFADVI